MSKELTDQNGLIVGSGQYFRRLNDSYLMGTFMRRQDCTAYDKGLENAAASIRDAAQEIYEDLQKHIQIIRCIPSAQRERTVDALKGFAEVCKMVAAGTGRIDSCISILRLSDWETRPKSRAGDREIEKAASFLESGIFFSRSDGMDIIRKAADWGESAVSGDMEKVLFLRMVAQDRDKDFLRDVWENLHYRDDPRRFTGHCGQAICSEGYIECIERKIFQTGIFSWQHSKKEYARSIAASLRAIAASLERDLERGISDGHYLRDESAHRLKEAIKTLANCGVSCYSLERKVDELAWFVGGDPDKIRRLQEKLNELGMGNRLTEDGVYGKKTEKAVCEFMETLLHGTVPTLVWVDPLQSDLTGIYVGSKTTKAGGNFSHIMSSGSNTPLFRADKHTYKGNLNYYHINVASLQDAPSWQRGLAKKLDHAPISKEAHHVLRNFQTSGKRVRTAGKVLLVAGVALDALELYQAVEADLKDADRKIGKKTYGTAAEIGGSWASGALGAKAGAATGAAIGTAILPGVGTALGGVAGGLILGIAGSIFGSSLGKWAVDMTVLE